MRRGTTKDLNDARFFERSRRPILASAAGVVGCLLASSCSVVVDADRSQCSSDADCARRGPEFAGAVCIDSLCASDPTWSCLGRPRSPANSDAGPFDVELTLIDLVTREPLAGVLGALCRKLDVECRVPLGDVIATNDAGQARFAALQRVSTVTSFCGARRPYRRCSFWVRRSPAPSAWRPLRFPVRRPSSA